MNSSLTYQELGTQPCPTFEHLALKTVIGIFLPVGRDFLNVLCFAFTFCNTPESRPPFGVSFLLECNPFSLVDRSRLSCCRCHTICLRQYVCCDTVSCFYEPSCTWICLFVATAFLLCSFFVLFSFEAKPLAMRGWLLMNRLVM